MSIGMHSPTPVNRGKWRRSKNVVGTMLIGLLLGQFTAIGQAKTISLPLTIDYPLLRTLTIQAAFTGPDQTARVLDIEDGCTTVTISNPRFAEHNGLVRFETSVTLTAGKSFGNHCLMPVAWKGYVILLQQPEIDPKTWQLSFRTMDSHVLNQNHRPARVLGALWKLMRTWVYPYLNQIRIDLTPPVTDLKFTLLPMLHPDNPGHARKITDSMRTGPVIVDTGHVQVHLLLDTPPAAADDDRRQPPPAPLSKDELNQFISAWETWDALLVNMITSMAGKSLSGEQRQLLLDTLLDTRHRFVDALENDKIGKTFVKDQFLWAWKQIAPIFRAHLSKTTPQHTLGYLAFFTASDALSALDQLGSATGIEISREGLIRLARLLGGTPDSLRYQPETNTHLRRIFDFPPFPGGGDPTRTSPPPEIVPPPPGGIDIPPPAEQIHSWWRSIHDLILPCPAMAGETTVSLTRLRPWIVPKSNLHAYLDRIKKILRQSADAAIGHQSISPDYHQLFKTLIYATAWQESCFRQFHVRKSRLIYLRSYNGSSVGLMQVNERVWRGIYDLNRLRWDIRYNASAGCEITATYFRRYFLKRIGQIKSLNTRAMAGIIYAMYNGGPSQFNKFLTRLKKDRLQLSDRLFREKYAWVIHKQWEYIDRCLVAG